MAQEDILAAISKFVDGVRTGNEADINSFGSQAIQLRTSEILTRGAETAKVDDTTATPPKANDEPPKAE